MALGVKSKWDLIPCNCNINQYNEYLKNVSKDIARLKDYYPFIYEVIIPVNNSLINKVYEVYLIDKNMIDDLSLTENYIINKLNNRKVLLIIPTDYKNNGAKIILDKNLKIDRIPDKHVHINGYYRDGYEFCAGVPQSMINLNNVLLENCRTAENYIVQVNSYLNNEANEINMIEYSHGDRGREEYDREKRRKRKKY